MLVLSISRWSFFLLLWTVSLPLAVNAQESDRDAVLEKFKGDWMFRGDHKQMWYGFQQPDGTLRIKEQFNAICGRVTRKWTIKGKNENGQYVGTVQTIFRGERTESIVGEWDDTQNTMTWTLDGDPDRTKVRHQFKEAKIVVATRRESTDPSRDSWHEHGTLFLLSR